MYGQNKILLPKLQSLWQIRHGIYLVETSNPCNHSLSQVLFSQILVYERMTRHYNHLSNINVYLSNVTATVGQTLTPGGDFCDGTGTLSGFRPTRQPFVCPPNTRGRFIQVIRSAEYITVTEIEVFAWEDDGRGEHHQHFVSRSRIEHPQGKNALEWKVLSTSLSSLALSVLGFLQFNRVRKYGQLA